MNNWDEAGRILQAAAAIVDTVTRLMMAKNVDRIADALPILRAQIEKTSADLKAALKYGRRS